MKKLIYLFQPLTLLALGLIILAYNLVAIPALAQTPMTLSHQQIQTMPQLIENKELLLIDVRTPEEFSQGHLQSAIQIEYQNIAQEISAHAPDKATPIFLYCRAGRRSGIAQMILRDMGYEHVQNLGGYTSLKQAGYLVVE